MKKTIMRNISKLLIVLLTFGIWSNSSISVKAIDTSKNIVIEETDKKNDVELFQWGEVICPGINSCYGCKAINCDVYKVQKLSVRFSNKQCKEVIDRVDFINEWNVYVSFLVGYFNALNGLWLSMYGASLSRNYEMFREAYYSGCDLQLDCEFVISKTSNALSKYRKGTKKFIKTVGASSNNSYPGYVVHYGDKGAVVTKVQQRLNSIGFTLTADGSFGPATKSAVINFQKSRGLDPDGYCGPATWSKLFNKSFKPSYPGYAVHYGSTGTIVITVQARLNQLGYGVGVPDGSFGPATKNALLKFQKSKGLSSDGYCGPATWSKLF